MLKMMVRNFGEVTIYACEGSLVFPEAETLRLAVLAHPPIRLAVLDLAGIKAIDAAGLGILVSLRGWSSATGTRFKLMNLTPRVECLLEITRLRPLFEICSVGEVFELFCRAFNRSRPLETEARREIPAEVLDDSGTMSNEAQW